jgi:hypothetical protein
MRWSMDDPMRGPLRGRVERLTAGHQEIIVLGRWVVAEDRRRWVLG